MCFLFKKIFCSLAISVLLIGCFSLEVAAEEGLLPVEYAYPDQSVWTTKMLPTGEPDNPLLKVAERIFAQAGIKWTSNSYPAKRLYERMKSGESNFSILVPAPQLKDDCIFSNKPVTVLEVRVYHKVDSPRISSKEGLFRKSVVVMRGYTFGDLGSFLRDQKNGVELTEAGRHEQAFELFKNGRADYLIDYAGPSNEVLAANPVKDITYEVLSRVNVYLILSRKYPDAEKVMSRLEKIAGTIDVREFGLEAP